MENEVAIVAEAKQVTPPQQKEISSEELQVYDRQRFIGVEVQKRLLNSRVLITPANGVNTELAKNLILCGTNLSIADNETVTQDDVETNFLIGPMDLGKNRGEVVKARLADMNPMVKIDLYPTFDVKSFYTTYIKKEGTTSTVGEDFLKAFDIITSSTKSFKEMWYYDEISQVMNIPYYNQLCCGLYGFFFVSLGSSFECVLQKPTTIKVSMVKGKMVKEKISFEYYHRATIISERLNAIEKAAPSGAKPVFFAIQMMKRAELAGLSYDPYLEGDSTNEEALENIVKLAGEERLVKEEDREFYRDFARFYGIEHCPVYSVIGSVASQEFIKVIARDKQPALNWFVYDSQIGYGKVESTFSQLNATYVDLPELTKTIENY